MLFGSIKSWAKNPAKNPSFRKKIGSIFSLGSNYGQTECNVGATRNRAQF
jgi:hypothetical protein